MDTVNYLQFILSLLFVVSLIALCAYVLRKTGMAFLPVAMRKGRQKQVTLLESTALDAKRRLNVIRWRGEDHLVLTGSEQDLLISTKEAKAIDGQQESAMTAPQNAAQNFPLNDRTFFNQTRSEPFGEIPSPLPTSSEKKKGA